jgi:hypothetical protein
MSSVYVKWIFNHQACRNYLLQQQSKSIKFWWTTSLFVILWMEIIYRWNGPACSQTMRQLLGWLIMNNWCYNNNFNWYKKSISSNYSGEIKRFHLAANYACRQFKFTLAQNHRRSLKIVSCNVNCVSSCKLGKMILWGFSLALLESCKYLLTLHRRLFAKYWSECICYITSNHERGPACRWAEMDKCSYAFTLWMQRASIIMQLYLYSAPRNVQIKRSAFSYPNFWR